MSALPRANACSLTVLAIAGGALGALFAVGWWVTNTDAIPIYGDPFSMAWTRVEFMMALPLRLVALAFTSNAYLRTAYHVWLITAFMAPMCWLLALWVAWALLGRRGRAASSIPRLDTGRRAFLAQTALGTAGAGCALVGLNAVMVAPQRLQLRTYDIAMRDLPPALEGLRIAHVSDTHLGPFVSRRMLARALERVNALQPDLVVLTGDYVYRHPRFIPDGIGMLAMLRPRIGSVAVLGNHDHWLGGDACRDAFAQTAIPLLDNGRLFLDETGLLTHVPKGAALCVGGLGDLWEDTLDFEACLGGVPQGMPRVVLAHNPDTAELVTSSQRIDLMFSGHTHGGQARLPILGAPLTPSRYGERFLGGRCQGTHCEVIVSRGVGMAGMPARFCVPPELGLITLTRA